MACAFHFYHHWSHQTAYNDTAQKTAAVVGLDWGGGLYANYLFALVWGVDVLWWWHHAHGYQSRSRFIEWAVQGYLAFIPFNSTVVFGTGSIRWLGLAASLFLTCVIGYTGYRRFFLPGIK
jgi:hypothetical protein